MPKSEKVKKSKFDDDKEPSEEGSSSSPAFQRATEHKLSLNLAARMKKKVTDTRIMLDEENPEHIRRKEKEVFRAKAHLLLEHPHDSTSSMVVCGVIFSMIVFSTVICCLETLPEMETEYWRYWFFWADVVFVAFFTIEYGVRYWASPVDHRAFVSETLNVIDLLALIPFYIELAVWLFFTSAHSNDFFRALQLLRVLRFIRVGRFSRDMLFISEGLGRSINFFVIMAYMLVLGVMLSSTFLFLLERGEWDSKKGCYARKGEVYFTGCSPFESVPTATWWAITTMATVGFGDAYPITVLGKIACGFTMVCGLLTVAIPTTVLSVEFALAYKQRLAETKSAKVLKSLTARTREELILYQSMQKLNRLTEEFRVHLPYLKHLTMSDNEWNLPSEEYPLVDPTYGLFQNRLMTDLYNVKFFVQATTNDLIF